MNRPVEVELPSGDVVWLHAPAIGPADVAAVGPLRLDAEQLRSTVRGVSHSLRDALEDVVPDQVQIEFGLELAVKTGKLTSMLAEAAGKATIKLTLSWSGTDAGPVIATAEPAGDEE
jgi:hypothetical protein